MSTTIPAATIALSDDMIASLTDLICIDAAALSEGMKDADNVDAVDDLADAIDKARHHLVLLCAVKTGEIDLEFAASIIDHVIEYARDCCESIGHDVVSQRKYLNGDADYGFGCESVEETTATFERQVERYVQLVLGLDAFVKAVRTAQVAG